MSEEQKRLRFSLKTMLLSVVVLSIVLFVGREVYLSVLPVPPHKLALLKLGMSKSEVRKILGEPNETTAGNWTYARNFDIGFVHVWFDDDNLLSGTDPEPTEFYYNYP